MSPEIGKAATRLALFLIVTAGLLLFLVPWGSAESVVLVLTIGAGLLLLVVVALLARAGNAPWTRPAGRRDDEGRTGQDED